MGTPCLQPGGLCGLIVQPSTHLQHTFPPTLHPHAPAPTCRDPSQGTADGPISCQPLWKATPEGSGTKQARSCHLRGEGTCIRPDPAVLQPSAQHFIQRGRARCWPCQLHLADHEHVFLIYFISGLSWVPTPASTNQSSFFMLFFHKKKKRGWRNCCLQNTFPGSQTGR